MWLTTLSALVFVGQVVVVGQDVPMVSKALPACSTCVGVPSPVTDLIVQLQTSRDWMARERAARRLREVDWRRHPEVPGALAFSLLKDPARPVRFEAAESLTRMRTCSPVVHHALSRAATSDPSLLTRLQARKGLRTSAWRRESSCDVCATTGPVAPIPSTIEGESLGGLAPIPETLDPPPTISPNRERAPALESTPLERPRVAPLREEDLDLKPSAQPGPPLDSSVKPLRDTGGPAPAAEELAPLPDPDKGPRVKPQAGRIPPRPRVAIGDRPSRLRILLGNWPR